MCLATLGGLVTAFGVFAGSVASSASGDPSGQVTYGNSTFSMATMTFTGGGGTIEPAYNDTTGTLIYLQTPNGAHVHPSDHNTAPLYLPVYPKGSMDPASLNCAHLPADNCPDHGNIVAGLAESADPAVYGGGVAGHDHLAGIASSGGDFNVIWEPVVVLFNPGAPITHMTTLAQIQKAEKAGQVTLIPLPPASFHCSVVSAAAYARGTPAPAVAGP
jgi:hypothetical protein